MLKNDGQLVPAIKEMESFETIIYMQMALLISKKEVRSIFH